MFVKKQAQFIPYRKILREYQRKGTLVLDPIESTQNYFPEHKLAIECDEHDHKDRNINHEIRRQNFIEDQLNCKFSSYNHDAKGFMIKSVLNKIFQYIYQKRSSSIK